MTNPLAQDLGGVVRLFHETSGDTWAARGTRVVSDPEFPVLRGHVADCVEDDDAAFIAACHEFFRTHSADIAGALRDAEAWQPIESAPRDGTKVLIAGGTYSYDMYVDETYNDVTIAYWYGNHWRGEDRQAHDEWNTHNPTHWRPLPAPPTQDSAMQQGGGHDHTLDAAIDAARAAERG